MTQDDIARLAYLALLLIAVGGWVIADGRRNLGMALRRILSWCLIFVAVVGGYGLWQDIRRETLPRQLVHEGGGRIEVPRSFDGHYYLVAEIDGVAVDFVVDTGATDIVLTRADAARVGIDPATLRYDGRASTANGIVRSARVRLDSFRLGGVLDRDVTAVVNEGEMETSLLGMRYLQRFERLEIADNRLVLER